MVRLLYTSIDMEYEGEKTFEGVAKLGGYLARPYAQDLLRLLVTYRDISASEAASRLDLHISTAQDFLEGMSELEIVAKQEVHEKKRPYFRYSLKQTQINLAIDLSAIRPEVSEGELDRQIRERSDTGARFSTARGQDLISSVTIWTGEGRQRKEHKINLTRPQGQFLFHLPLPTAEPMSIVEIMLKADVDETLSPEIVDMVQLLAQYGVIEVQ